MSRRATWGAALAVCLAFASQTTSTQAAPAYPAPIVGKETTAHAWGVETRFTQSTPCQVDITLNQTVFLAHMPEMIHQGIFNSQVTPALQQQAPHYLMNTFQTDTTPGFVHTLFTQSGAPTRCRFAWSYIAPDGTRHPMLAFDMTRQAHDRIDWNRPRFGEMAAAAQNPWVDREFDTVVNQETLDVTITLAKNHDSSADLPPPSDAASRTDQP